MDVVKWIACWEEPHCRSIDVPGTDSGSFDASTALRATLVACSPTWLTQPISTSSIAAGSAPLRATSSSITWAARSTGCQAARRPLRLPPAVRTAATMKASSDIASLLRFPRGLQFIVLAVRQACVWIRSASSNAGAARFSRSSCAPAPVCPFQRASIQAPRAVPSSASVER